MAYDSSSSGPYSGRPQFLLYVYVRRDATDVANNRASYAYEIRALNPDRSSASYYLDPVGGVINFDPGNPAADRPFSANLDFRNGQEYLVLAQGNTGWFNHNPDGTLRVNWAAAHGPIGQFGTGYTTGFLDADRIPRPPAAPGAPTFSNISPTNIRVTVSAPNNNGATIDAYDFQYSVNSNMSGATTRNHNGNILDINPLSPGTTYYFRVRAHNVAGWGDWSPIRSATTSTTPGAPTNLRSGGTPGTTTVPLAWTAPSSNGGSAITGYQVQRATNSSFTSGTATLNATGTTATFGSLSPGTTYYFRVRALNAVGYGGWSNTFSNTTAPSTPATPTVAPQETSAAMSWTDSNGNGITGYDYQFATNSSFTGATLRSVGAVNSTLITGLTGATQYWVRVRAKTAAATSGWSGARSFITVPVAPTTPTTSSVTPTGMTVSWTRGSNGTQITSYDVAYSTSSSFPIGSTTQVNTGDNRTTLNLTNLTPGTTYYIRVRARNGTGVGAWSGVRTQATPASGAPGLTVVAAANGRSATATMTPPGGIGSVNSYEVQYRIGSSGTITTRTTTTNSVTVTGLTPGTTYQWRARAVIGTYNSPYTAWQSLAQPNPSTEPGDYFDGSTPDKTHTTYAWTGTANNSKSQAIGKLPMGWNVQAQGSGATAVLMRDSGGRSQPYCARLVITRDATAAGMTFGQWPTTSFSTPIGEGGTYYGMIHVKAVNRSQRLVAQVSWYDASGNHIATTEGTSRVVAVGQGWVRLSVSDVAPPGSATAVIRVKDVTGDGWSLWLCGDQFLVDDMLLSLTPGTGYFDGATKDTATYIYDWTGTPNASSSVRTEQDDPGSAIQDPDCPPAPAPPRPPAIDESCVEDETMWRRYWVAVDKVLVEGWIDSVPVVRIHATAPSRLVRVRYYQNPLDLPIEDIDPESFFAEQLISYIPGDTTYILDGTLERMWAELPNGDVIPADHLLYGQGGESPAWPVFSGGISHYVTVDVPLDSPDDSIEVNFDLILRY